jgi:signal peptidase I
MKKSHLKRELFSWIRMIVLAVTFALLISNFLIVNARVPSSSMESTIMTGERVIGFRLTYMFEEPKRGDVIIFKFPDDESQVFIKRIVGLPGEEISIVDGKVYIDQSASPLDEPYLTVVPVGDAGPFTVPEDAYFVMGDNRNVSFDSRYWENHFVKREAILAKAVAGYYPDIYIIK